MSSLNLVSYVVYFYVPPLVIFALIFWLIGKKYSLKSDPIFAGLLTIPAFSWLIGCYVSAKPEKDLPNMIIELPLLACIAVLGTAIGLKKQKRNVALGISVILFVIGLLFRFFIPLMPE